MKIFPAIDIINGECVRLTKGLAENKTIYDKSPVEMAKIYQDKGFETIHVVDLDATLGKGNNDKTLDLIRKNININIEVAGGIRDKTAIQNKINQGFDIIVIGTFAIKGIDEVSKFENNLDVALFEFNCEMICLLLWRVSTFALVISGSTNLLNSFPFSTVVLITSCSIRDAARFLIIAILCDDVLLNLLLSFLCLILHWWPVFQHSSERQTS